MKKQLLGLFFLTATVAHADPCTASLGNGTLDIYGPAGVETFNFGLTFDDHRPLLTSPSECFVLGAAETTSDPFIFAAHYGDGGFQPSLQNTPTFGNGIGWESPSGNFLSLPFDFETGTLNNIQLIGVGDDGFASARIFCQTVSWDLNRGSTPVPEISTAFMFLIAFLLKADLIERVRQVIHWLLG